jgi:hypothetical protein
MLQQSLSSNELPIEIKQSSLAVKNSSRSNGNDREEKTCTHRDENGWCSKSQRQCSSLIDFYLKH